MKSNPLYDNICWSRFQGFGKNKCNGCSKEIECYLMYNAATGDWEYPKDKISRRELSPVKLRVKPTSPLFGMEF